MPSLSVQYDSCDDLLVEHVYDPCPENREFARVRSVALIRKAALAAILVNPTDVTLWNTAIAAGNAIIIPETSGNYDPGDPKKLKGYGDRKETNGTRSQKLVFNDPNYEQNYQFYNNISEVNDLVVAFRTSSLIHIADVPASIFAKDPVEDNLEAEVTWMVTCDWESKNLPQKHASVTLDAIFKP
jgi:hypothetical protein